MENALEFSERQPYVKKTNSKKYTNYEETKNVGRLSGGAPYNDRNYYRRDVAGRPVYYEDGPPPPQHAGRLSGIRQRGSYDDDSLDSDDEYFTEFTDKKIRHAFIKKVYFILFIQLGYTACIIALFVLELVGLIFYLVLVCSMSCRRNFPGNIILLGIYTVLSSIGFGGIAALYAPMIVLYSFAITAAVCLIVTLLAMQPWIDITGWGIYLCIISMVLMLFGMVCMIMMLVMGWNDTTRILYLVYASIAALVCSMYFMFMTQLILGGKKYSLSPEEYILGAIILYTDIMQLFMLILSIFGAASQ